MGYVPLLCRINDMEIGPLHGACAPGTSDDSGTEGSADQTAAQMRRWPQRRWSVAGRWPRSDLRRLRRPDGRRSGRDARCCGRRGPVSAGGADGRSRTTMAAPRPTAARTRLARMEARKAVERSMGTVSRVSPRAPPHGARNCPRDPSYGGDLNPPGRHGYATARGRFPLRESRSTRGVHLRRCEVDG